MKWQKKWVFVEVIVVGLILIILCAVMLPRFLQKQKTAAPYRLIKHFQVLLDAMEQYQTDYGGIPLKKPSARALIRSATVPNFKNNTLLSNYTLEDIDHPYLFFYERGYLDSMPDFSEFDPYLYSIKTDSPYSQHQRTTITLHIGGDDELLVNRQSEIPFENALTKIENMYIWVMWLKADLNDVFHFQKYNMDNNNFITSSKYFKENGQWMPPSNFYCPSNGLHSAGYIYLDSEGNHSPWE